MRLGDDDHVGTDARPEEVEGADTALEPSEDPRHQARAATAALTIAATPAFMLKTPAP